MRDRFGPAGARTAQVTEADLGRHLNYETLFEMGGIYLQHLQSFTLVDVSDPTEFVISASSF